MNFELDHSELILVRTLIEDFGFEYGLKSDTIKIEKLKDKIDKYLKDNNK